MNRCYYQSSLCQNGGTCVPGADGAFTCRCPASYGGVYCSQYIQISGLLPYSNNAVFVQVDLISGVCASVPCQNGGTCVAYNNNANYYCQCPQEYSGSMCCMLLNAMKRNKRREFLFSNIGDSLSDRLLY